MRGRGTPRDRANIKEHVLPVEAASPTRSRATGSSSSEVMPISNMQAPTVSVFPPITMPHSTTLANTTVPFQATPPNAVTVPSASWTPPDSTTDIREVQELTRNLRKRRKRISDDDTTNNSRSASGGSSIGTESTLSESIHSESVYDAEHA